MEKERPKELKISSFGGVFSSVSRIAFCSPIMFFFGVCMVMMAFDIKPLKTDDFEVPKTFMAACGIMYVLCGVFLGVNGFRIISRRKNFKKLPAPGRYLFEYNWTTSHVVDHSVIYVKQQIVLLFTLATIIMPFHMFVIYPALYQSVADYGPKWLYYAFLIIMDFFVIVLVFIIARVSIAQGLAVKTRIRFSEFPYKIGGTLSAVFDGGAKFKNVKGVSFTLRLIKESLELPGAREFTRSDVLYESKVDKDTDDSGCSELRFDIPADLPGSKLVDYPPTYWEIEAKVALKGLNYKGIFIMPIFERV